MIPKIACPCKAFDRDSLGYVVPSMENRCYCGHDYEDHLDDGLSRCVGRVADPDAESTSAALARVERERDELAAAFDEADVARLNREVDLGRARREREEALDALHLARAELATARQELEVVRMQLVAVSAEVVTARQELDALRTLRDQEELPDKEDW